MAPSHELKGDTEGGEMPSARALLADGGSINYSRGVFILAFGFLGVFGGFQAAQGLQTSLNATLGFINLAALYGTFTVVCLAAPALLSALEAKVGITKIMLVSALAYVAMILSNLYTKVWAIPITMNALVGVGAPLLWTCQNDYVGRCAYHASQASGETLETLTARFNGIFFSIYQGSGAIGNIVASTLLLAFSDKAWLKDVLFFVLGGFATAGAFVFLLMPGVPPGGDQAAEAPSLKATGQLAISDKRMTLFIPLILTNGMCLGFLFGDFPADIVCPVAGSSFTGFVMATFFGVNCVATRCWGSLVSTNKVSRRTAYMVATCCEITFFVIKLAWSHPNYYAKNSNDDNKWDKNGSGDPEFGDYLVIFLMVSVFAIGDAYWESGPAGTLQNFFMETPDIVPAMANLKMWQSLGFAVQFIIGATLGAYPVFRAGLLIGLSVVAILSLLVLDRSVPLDPRADA